MSQTSSNLVPDLGAESSKAARSVRELRTDNKEEFLDQALKWLRDPPDPSTLARLLRLTADPRILELFTDPDFLAGPEALALATRMQGIDPDTEVRLLRLLLPRDDATMDPWRTNRVLEIVAAISSGKRIQTLLAVLLRHTDARVRSKAALLIGRANRNLGWLEHGMESTDPRIRANAVEALWGLDTHDAKVSFLAATEDAHHRVAANGVVGLHRAGDLGSAPIVEAMASHQDPMLRAAAVWAMGETQDPRFLPTLTRFMAENTGCVRRNALRAIVQIRKRIGELKKEEPLTVTVTMTCQDGIFEVRVEASGAPVLALPPTAFVVMEGTHCLALQAVRAKGNHKFRAGTATAALAAPFYEVVLAAPTTEAVRICVYTAFGTGEGEAGPA